MVEDLWSDLAGCYREVNLHSVTDNNNTNLHKAADTIMISDISIATTYKDCEVWRRPEVLHTHCGWARG